MNLIKKINSIQFWGHGSPGRVWINGKDLSNKSLLNHKTHTVLLEKLRERLTPDSVIWFRACNVFAGFEGHLFAKAFSKFMNCKIAAHTYIIWAWQSGLHTAVPNQKPVWPQEEGLDRDKRPKLWSLPWLENTVFCLTGKIPKNW